MTTATPFNTVILPENYDCIIVSSDEEPDDAVAKYVLMRGVMHHSSPSHALLWITGEGRQSKLELIKDQADALGIQHCVFVQGRLSEREYPLELHGAFADRNPFRNTTADASLPVPAPAGAAADESNCLSTLRSFLERYERPLFVMLKPCWELLEMPSELVAKVTLAAYGSFNFRCLFEKNSRPQLADFFNNSFKRVLLYETFFVMGEDNSCNSINAPRLYEIIRQKAAAGERFWVGVRDSVAIWNNHIVLSQLKSVQKVSKAMYDAWDDESREIATAGDADVVWKKRKANVDKVLQGGAKIVNSIVAAKGQQMVFADFGLTALMLAESRDALPAESVVQCRIAFDEGRGNTIVKPDAAGKVFVLKNVDRKKLTELVERAIE